MTHCCCEVRIIQAVDSDVRFCGDFLGCGAIVPTCNIDATFTCPSIDGFYLIYEVTAPDTLLFCIPRAEAFIIRNYGGDLSLEIECQQDSGPPVIIPLVLDEYTTTTLVLTDSCIPDQCD